MFRCHVSNYVSRNTNPVEMKSSTWEKSISLSVSSTKQSKWRAEQSKPLFFRFETVPPFFLEKVFLSAKLLLHKLPVCSGKSPQTGKTATPTNHLPSPAAAPSAHNKYPSRPKSALPFHPKRGDQWSWTIIIHSWTTIFRRYYGGIRHVTPLFNSELSKSLYFWFVSWISRTVCTGETPSMEKIHQQKKLYHNNYLKLYHVVFASRHYQATPKWSQCTVRTCNHWGFCRPPNLSADNSIHRLRTPKNDWIFQNV